MRFAAAFAALFLVAPPAAAEERILSYDSQVAIQKNGDLDVTETIRFNVENVRINHGIFRDFPTRYDLPRGGRAKIGFTLLDTSLDGAPEPNSTSHRSNGVRIKIGDADRTVSTGEHDYRIHYRVTRELGRFADYDELYWNVTGTGWDFPIDRASATLTLPSPATFGQRSAYTGAQGASGTSARVVDEAPGRIRFETTAPLGAREGLTVAAAFPKGVVDEPTSGSKLRQTLGDYAPPLVGLLSLLGLLGYLYHAWKAKGRDPKAGTVVPLFSPPDGLSPSAMRYIVQQKMDNRGFAAALVDAAIKGHVRLIQEKSGLFGKEKRSIERLMGTAQPLGSAESGALSALAMPGETLAMDNENHEAFASAIKALDRSYKAQYQGHLFNLNMGWAAAAIAVWLIGLWVTAVAILFAEDAGNFTMLLLACGGLGLSAILFGVAPREGGSRTFMLIAAGLVALISLFVGFPFIPEALATGRLLPFLPVVIGLPFALSAFWWMSAPTLEGRRVLDRIAGFKQYLSITERQRLDRMQAPQDNLQLFEKYLPYAIALGVENRWADRFAGVLAAASAAAASSGSQPFLWYSGSHSPWTDTGGFVNSLGSSLSSTIASSATAPGSSSESGGGGFSGGGGGGGGGGGW